MFFYGLNPAEPGFLVLLCNAWSSLTRRDEHGVGPWAKNEYMLGCYYGLILDGFPSSPEARMSPAFYPLYSPLLDTSNPSNMFRFLCVLAFSI